MKRLWKVWKTVGSVLAGTLERHGQMSGTNFISLVVVILILLFIIINVGPLLSAF